MQRFLLQSIYDCEKIMKNDILLTDKEMRREQCCEGSSPTNFRRKL